MCQSRVVISGISLCVPSCILLCVFPQGINRTILSWLRLWDEAVFGRPTPLKSTGSSGGGGGTGAGGRGKGGFTGEGAKGVGPSPMGRRFEKRMEYQNPEAFAGTEVSVICPIPGSPAKGEGPAVMIQQHALMYTHTHTHTHTRTFNLGRHPPPPCLSV